MTLHVRPTQAAPQRSMARCHLIVSPILLSIGSVSQMRVGQELKLATVVRRKSRQEFFTLTGWHDEHVAVSSEACGMEQLSSHARLTSLLLYWDRGIAPKSGPLPGTHFEVQS